MTLKRQTTGQAPFEEVWFIEALLGPTRGLWLRFRVDATAGELEAWAIVSTPDGVIAAEKQVFPMGELKGIFQCPAARLEPERTVGEVGSIRWDLHLEDRGARHHHMPLWMRAVGIGKTYSPAILDLRIRGEIWVDGVSWRVDKGPGILGHHWGRASRVGSWVWAHCNAFDREDLVFEGLSATIGPVTLTSVMLLADGHAYRFSSTRHLLRTWTRTREDGWVFEAREGSRLLTGHLRLDPKTAATVRYPTGGAGRTATTCTNTRFGTVRLVLTDPSRGLDLDVKSRECAFELVGEQPRAAPIL